MMIGPKWEMPRRVAPPFTTVVTRDYRCQDAWQANCEGMARCLDAPRFQKRTHFRYVAINSD